MDRLKLSTTCHDLLTLWKFEGVRYSDNDFYTNPNGHMVTLFEGNHGFLNRDHYFETYEQLSTLLTAHVQGKIYNGRAYEKEKA